MSFSLSDRDLDLNKWKVADLRKELKARNLNVEGKKNELVERLQMALGESALLDDTVNDQDEILDEDVLTDDEPFEDSELSKPDTPEPEKTVEKEKLELGLKRKSVIDENESLNKQPKKIILNRNISALDKDINKTEGKENQEKTSSEICSEKKTLVGVGSLSPQERLERRAAKFGVVMSNEAKKKARAARFGLPTSGSKIGDFVNTNLDVLKKRAERFGTTLSDKVIETAEIEEKRKKREERFGKVEKTSVPVIKNKHSLQMASLEDKKRLRAERFKSK